MGSRQRARSGPAFRWVFLIFACHFAVGAPALLAGARFIRGDANSDAKADISDPIVVLGFLFTGDSLVTCQDAADADDSGRIDITDAVFLLNYFFLAGDRPPPPFPESGWDPTPDCLGCRKGTPRGESPPGTDNPHHPTLDLNHPRYLHQAIRLEDGLVLAAGGTDERGFSTIALAEVFNEKQGLFGTWFDTDFAGNPIRMEFPRLWHTLSSLPDHRVVAIGGTADWLNGRPIAKAEIFNPVTRQFQTLENGMVFARARHAVSITLEGDILLTGGLIHQRSDPLNADLFPSTATVEVLDFPGMEFRELTLSAGGPSRLASPRGRAGHVAAAFAGFDGRLRTADDLVLIAGGFETSPDGELVQRTMVPRLGETNRALVEIEVHDPASGAFFQLPDQLRFPRVNDPQATNLGLFNDFTPDGIAGLGNVILVTHGDDNGGCPVTAAEDELFAAGFTGLGPAQGLVLNRIVVPDPDPALAAHRPGMEAAVLLGRGSPAGFLPEVPTTPPHFPGRTLTNIVALPRQLEPTPGVKVIVTWIFAGSGVHLYCTPACPVEYHDGTIGTGALFDPFYRLLPPSAFQAVPPADPRDLTATRSATNPTGVVGAWLALDGRLPSRNRTGFGDTPFSNWPQDHSNRVYPFQVAVAGGDGVINTIDDRVLLSGGGQDALNLGGEPSAPSSAVVIIPRN